MHKYLLLLVAATACGGGSVSREDFPQQYARASCAKLFDCCSAAELQALGGILQFDDEDSCALRFEATIAAGFMEFDGDIEAGLIVYDGGTAQDCLDDVNDSACTEINGAAIACGRIFEGQLENGESCASDEICASGNCQGARCENPPGLGEPCENVCADDLSCAAGECRALEDNGAACVLDEQCRSSFCDPDAGVCAASMTCDGVD